MTNHNTPTLTVEQAARRIDCSPTWLNQLLIVGRVKGKKIDNRWQVDAASLDDYIAHGRKKRGPQNKGQAKATLLDAPLGDDERGIHHYPGVIQLVYAILQQAAEEAVAGDLPAQQWIDSP